MSGRTLWLNASSGLSGDMIAATLLHLGADGDAIRGAVAALALSDVAVSWRRVRKGAIEATSFDVAIGPGARRLRTPSDVASVLDGAGLPADVDGACRRAFEALAEAEGSVHGEPAARVHFHELGSPDTLVDVVAAVVGLRSLDVGKLLVSPVNLGGGTVATAHGRLPVPAPAVAALLTGFTAFTDGEESEKTTPTGALLASVFGRTCDAMPPMEVERTGYGAGTADFKRSLNVLQGILGSEPGGHGEHQRAVVIETTIDDMNPQIYPVLLGHLLEAGAHDALIEPVLMKKGRPGHRVTVISPPEAADRLSVMLLAESSSIGLRRWPVERLLASRRIETLATPLGEIRVKVAGIGGCRRAVPEFEDCRRVAEEAGRPLIEIMTELAGLAAARFGSTRED
jgi:uncharacterized protein (TIGR00299 family) protein